MLGKKIIVFIISGFVLLVCASWIGFYSKLDARREKEIDLSFPVSSQNEKKKPSESKEFLPMTVSSEKTHEPKKIEIQKEIVKEEKKIASIVPEKKEMKKEESKENIEIPKKSPEAKKENFGKHFLSGIYLNAHTALNAKKLESLTGMAEKIGMNALVIDVQPKSIPVAKVTDLKKRGFYTVARVVNFDGGLDKEYPTEQKLESLKKIVRTACENGFDEIQLDYIRYKDQKLSKKLTISAKYKNITKVIQSLRQAGTSCRKDLLFGADLFGRIPFRDNDLIGQKIEVFAGEVENLYPMLYPSHFYGENYRIKNPYKTIYDGVKKTQKKMGSKNKVIPYIQGFKMAVKKTKHSFQDYIKVQMAASRDSGADGFIVWNANNDYKSTFLAYSDWKRDKSARVSDEKLQPRKTQDSKKD